MMRFYLLFLCLALSVGSCSDIYTSRGKRAVDDSMAVYLEQIQQCFSRQDYDRALEMSYMLEGFGSDSGSEKCLLYADIYKAQCFMAMNITDSMYYYFDRTLATAQKNQDIWALATIYNAMGGNAAFGEGDYSRGIACLTEGLKYASDIKDTSRIVLLESNLAMLYYVIDDFSGLKYALDVFRIGQERGNDYNIFLGALISASLYWMANDRDNALWYVEQAMPHVEKFDPSRETYVLYADILRASGDDADAVMYYDKAFRERSGPGLYSLAGLYLGYARYLTDNGKDEKAVEVLLHGLRTMDTLRSPVNEPLIYASLSEIYERRLEYQKALSYHKMYKEAADKQLSLVTEREIKKIQMAYERQQHEMELLGWQNKYNMAVMAFAFAVCVVSGLYVLYYNKRKNYLQLFRQHQTILECQDAKTGDSPLPMSQDKMKEMFDRLEVLMREQELYRQSDLSRDIVAQMLSTNRTYLCSAIKSYTGMSFTYYVNSFRINEAVRILSDPEDNTPIKALAGNLGYNNLTSFYRLFEAAKGMPPSKYRESVVQNAKLANCKNL